MSKKYKRDRKKPKTIFDSLPNKAQNPLLLSVKESIEDGYSKQVVKIEQKENGTPYIVFEPELVKQFVLGLFDSVGLLPSERLKIEKQTLEILEKNFVALAQILGKNIVTVVFTKVLADQDLDLSEITEQDLEYLSEINNIPVEELKKHPEVFKQITMRNWADKLVEEYKTELYEIFQVDTAPGAKAKFDTEQKFRAKLDEAFEKEWELSNKKESENKQLVAPVQETIAFYLNISTRSLSNYLTKYNIDWKDRWMEWVQETAKIAN